MSRSAFSLDGSPAIQAGGNRAHVWLALQALRTVAAAHHGRSSEGAGKSGGAGSGYSARVAASRFDKPED